MAVQIGQAVGMKTDIIVRSEDRARLERLVGDRNTPAKVVWRARIVLASADGNTVRAVARLTGKSKPCVWRWQARFAEEGVEGLLRDKTRPPGRKPLPQSVKLKVFKMTANETPPNARQRGPRPVTAPHHQRREPSVGVGTLATTAQ